MTEAKNGVIINCLQCNKEMNLFPSEIKKGKKYCSYSCRSIHLWSQKEYLERLSLVHRGQQNALGKHWKVKDSSKMSHSAWNKGVKMPEISGKNHYLWVEDRTKLHKYGEDNKDRRSSAYRDWRINVWKRDGFRCKMSNNDCSGKIVAHHILAWRDFVELRYEINNGITLCHFHHPRKRIDEAKLSPFFQELLVAEIK